MALRVWVVVCDMSSQRSYIDSVYSSKESAEARIEALYRDDRIPADLGFYEEEWEVDP